MSIKAPTTANIHGIDVTGITYKEPGNNLPKWIRQQAETRGYGDSKVPLSLYIQEGDITEAFDCAAHGDGSACVMAQAGRRIGAKSVYFYRTSAWVDFGIGPIVRFETSKQIYNNVIDPFDRGARDSIIPGIYHLTPPKPGTSLERRREVGRGKKNRKGQKADGSRSLVAHAHTERVVMASRAGAGPKATKTK